MWAVPPAVPRLGAAEVHVWLVPLDIPRPLLTRLAAALSPNERSRAARFRFDTHRDRFTAGRALLRDLVARYLGIRAGEVRFRYSAYGKPALDGSAAESGVRFNLSNAGGLALVALTLRREVGVDLEEIKPLDDFAELAERFFSPAERAALRALSPEARETAFFTCWTRKEAYVKAVGRGLSIPLDSFDVTLAPGEAAGLLARGESCGTARWSLHALAPGAGYVGALAVEEPAPRVLCFEWAPPVAPLLPRRSRSSPCSLIRPPMP